MWRRRRQQFTWWTTALLPGLYAGRLLAEWSRPGLLGAVALTLLTVAVCALAWRRVSPQQALWPALPLAAYVFWPALNPAMALAAGGVALIAAALAPGSRRFLWARLPGASATRATGVLALLVFAASLALYTVTLAPGLLPADNGELQRVAAELGVAHPPGFALYTIVAHTFTRLPLGPTAAYRANLLSALIGATTLALVFLGTWRLTRSRPAGLLAAAALGTATTFWSQATTANVRSLTALFAALTLTLLLVIRDRFKDAESERGDAVPTKYVALFAFLLVLGITHHASLAFMGLVFTLYLLWLDPGLLRRPARWITPVLGALAGLLPLLYFPLRAGTGVRGASPALATLRGFLEHVLALGFRGDFFAFASPGELAARLGVMGDVMRFQFHPLLLAAIALGFLILLWRDRPLAFLLGGSFALHTLVTAAYRAPQTVEYMLPAYVAAVLLLGAAAGYALRADLWHRLRERGVPLQAVAALFAALLLVTAVAQGVYRYVSYVQLSRDHMARTTASALLEEAPQDSIILVDWHWATPLWYLQDVEGIRPDLDVRYVFPTAEPYAQTWARRIGENLQQGRAVLATHYDADAYLDLPPPEPVHDAFLFRQTSRTDLPAGFQALDLVLGDQIQIMGYQLSLQRVAPTHETILTLAWQPAGNTFPAATLFAHVVGADGALYAQRDVGARPQTEGLTLTQLRLTPRPGALPGDYALMVGAYESSSGQPLEDGEGRSRQRLATLAITAGQEVPVTDNATARPLVGESRRLVGYDWDNTLPERPRLYLHWRTPEGMVTDVRAAPNGIYGLPDHYGPWGLVRRDVTLSNDGRQIYVPLGQGIVWRGPPSVEHIAPPAPGQSLVLTPHFAASRPVLHDLVVSVRLIGYEEDNVRWAWWDLSDSVPALGAIPTLKWIGGSRVRDPHFMTVAPSAYEGQILGGLLTMYDAFSQRQVPILDERLSQEFLGLPLGANRVR